MEKLQVKVEYIFYNGETESKSEQLYKSITTYSIRCFGYIAFINKYK